MARVSTVLFVDKARAGQSFWLALSRRTHAVPEVAPSLTIAGPYAASVMWMSRPERRGRPVVRMGVVPLYAQRNVGHSAELPMPLSANGDFWNFRFWDWTLWRGAIRMFWAVSLIGIVWGAGHTKGTQRGVCDPEGVRQERRREALKAAGAVDACGQELLCASDSTEVAMVRRVFPRMLRAAREELASLEASLSSDRGVDREARWKKLQLARVQFNEWKDDGFLVLDVDAPNAFVDPMVPRLLFVQRGLFQADELLPVDPSAPPLPPGSRVAVSYSASAKGPRYRAGTIVGAFAWRYRVELDDDTWCTATSAQLRRIAQRHLVESEEQLAMLIGHELAHVLHGHTEEQAEMSALFAGSNLVIVAVLKLTGLVSFCSELLAGVVADGLTKKGRRSHESEADATGLRIAARACYDPEQAVGFFQRFAAAESSSLDVTTLLGLGQNAAKWRCSHPDTADRMQALEGAQADAMRLFRESCARERATVPPFPTPSPAPPQAPERKQSSPRRPVWPVVAWPPRRMDVATQHP